MDFTINQSKLNGAVQIPGSKSHTIRAVAIASLARGASSIFSPLDSSDAHSARRAYRSLGAVIDELDDEWKVEGLAGKPLIPDDVIDVRNSGTSMRIALGSASLISGDGAVVLTIGEGLKRLGGEGRIRPL
jgi:3-phosphoshikimate 1-carboxyvinyltransferase